ncbi:MAG: hypothetical protein JSV64_04360 [Candidatus Bathyarchaeota archaeon]|nr:MAG: hypothetical protein JSV64_04360 [Candidatus Bathyarchaeota archaeon]
MNRTASCFKRRFTVATILVASVATLFFTTHVVQRVSAQVTHEVEISNLAFLPQNLTINPGDTIRWNNTDSVIHTLWFVFTANGSTYLLSDPIPPGTTWSHTFTDSVELQYYSFDMLWITGFINVTSDLHDVAVTSLGHSKSGCLPKATVGQGFKVSMNVTVENQGGFIENFNITVKANTTEIFKTSVILNPGENHTLTFDWNTTLFSKGNYSLNANADVVPGETETSDNSFVDGVVLITLAGDVDGDRDIDIFDIVRMAGAYGVSKPHPKYDSNSDVDDDGDIDIFDIVAAASNYGKSW